MSSLGLKMVVFVSLFLFLFYYLGEEGQRERERDSQAPCGAQSHDPGNHDLNQKSRVNQLRHPGALKVVVFKLKFAQGTVFVDKIP